MPRVTLRGIRDVVRSHADGSGLFAARCRVLPSSTKRVRPSQNAVSMAAMPSPCGRRLDSRPPGPKAQGGVSRGRIKFFPLHRGGRGDANCPARGVISVSQRSWGVLGKRREAIAGQAA